MSHRAERIRDPLHPVEDAEASLHVGHQGLDGILSGWPSIGVERLGVEAFTMDELLHVG